MKNFQDTLVGGILDRVKNGEPITTMDHTLEKATIVRLSLAFLSCVVVYFIIKKYIFKY